MWRSFLHPQQASRRCWVRLQCRRPARSVHGPSVSRCVHGLSMHSTAHRHTVLACWSAQSTSWALGARCHAHAACAAGTVEGTRRVILRRSGCACLRLQSAREHQHKSARLLFGTSGGFCVGCGGCGCCGGGNAPASTATTSAAASRKLAPHDSGAAFAAHTRFTLSGDHIVVLCLGWGCQALSERRPQAPTAPTHPQARGGTTQ